MKRRTTEALVKIMERLFLREVLTFEGERHIGMRVDGSWPDRSVFAVASLDGGQTLAVARVYEADLERAPHRALHLVYLAAEDIELIRAMVLAGGVPRGPCE